MQVIRSIVTPVVIRTYTYSVGGGVVDGRDSD